MTTPDCHRCEEVQNQLIPGLPMRMMIVCPDCGNKRCPRASDHRLSCSGSNEPGQPGSIY